MNSGCATVQPVKMVDRLDAPLGSATAFNVVGTGSNRVRPCCVR